MVARASWPRIVGALAGNHDIVGIDRSPLSTTHLVGFVATKCSESHGMRLHAAVYRREIDFVDFHARSYLGHLRDG